MQPIIFMSNCTRKAKPWEDIRWISKFASSILWRAREALPLNTIKNEHPTQTHLNLLLNEGKEFYGHAYLILWACIKVKIQFLFFIPFVDVSSFFVAETMKLTNTKSLEQSRGILWLVLRTIKQIRWFWKMILIYSDEFCAKVVLLESFLCITDSIPFLHNNRYKCSAEIFEFIYLPYSRLVCVEYRE